MRLLILFHALCVFKASLSLVSLAAPNRSSHPSSFPSKFLFGTASSSYQFEGAFLSEGKGLSNWDVFSHEPGKIVDGSNGDVAVDHYHRYLEDLEHMEYIGVNSYRFSISWARILPKGRFGDVNMAGIKHYNKLIDALQNKGIQPFVSLAHYDIPQELEDQYGAWLSPKVQEDFKFYADVCFHYFGDRVKYWITFNEPNVAAIRGYRSGIYPPSRCSVSFGNCSAGNSERETFIAAHNMILSHVAAVHVYRTRYQGKQKGIIGIVMNAIWFEPFSNSSEDKLAAERAQSFYMNCQYLFSHRSWTHTVKFFMFLDPIMLGKYPAEMHEILRSLLPAFSKNDQKKLKNGLDFIGLNHYTSFYIKDCIYSPCEEGPGVTMTEGYILRTAMKDGVPIGQSTPLDWIFIYPQGMHKVISYVKDRYNNTPMFVTENGFGEISNPNSSIQVILGDVERVQYMNLYLEGVATAIRNGADVRGYFAWSLLDNFEWLSGYTTRFGLYYVDYSTLKRIPKLSATWYKQFISNQTFVHKLYQCNIM